MRLLMYETQIQYLKKKLKKNPFNTGSPQNYLNVCICIHITNKPCRLKVSIRMSYKALLNFLWELSIYFTLPLFDLRLNSIWLRIIPGMMKYPLTNENDTETRYALWYHECCHQLFDTHLVLSFRKKNNQSFLLKKRPVCDIIGLVMLVQCERKKYDK